MERISTQWNPWTQSRKTKQMLHLEDTKHHWVCPCVMCVVSCQRYFGLFKPYWLKLKPREMYSTVDSSIHKQLQYVPYNLDTPCVYPLMEHVNTLRNGFLQWHVNILPAQLLKSTIFGPWKSCHSMLNHGGSAPVDLWNFSLQNCWTVSLACLTDCSAPEVEPQSVLGSV